MRNAHHGYARDQLTRLADEGRFGGPDETRRDRHARYIRRLPDQGLHAHELGEIEVGVGVDDPERYHAFGRSCAGSTEPAERALAGAAERFARTTSPLRPHVDREAFDAWLHAVRDDHLHDRAAPPRPAVLPRRSTGPAAGTGRAAPRPTSRAPSWAPRRSGRRGALRSPGAGAWPDRPAQPREEVASRRPSGDRATAGGRTSSRRRTEVVRGGR